MNDPLPIIAEEIIMVRKLAVFALLNSGVSQEKVASALGVSQATVSRLSGGAAQGSRRATAKKKIKR
jgi:predicted transcriptional regulator